MPDYSKGNRTITIRADLVTWLTVHGNLLLALRHPQNTGPSRQLAEGFADELLKALVRSGLINEAEAKRISLHEIPYRPGSGRIILPS